MRKRINREQFDTGVYTLARLLCEQPMGPCSKCFSTAALSLTTILGANGVGGELEPPDLNDLQSFLEEIGAELAEGVKREIRKRTR
jgi:hypothetical protein